MLKILKIITNQSFSSMSSGDMASLVLALLLLLFTFSDIEKRFEQSTSSIIGDRFELVEEVFDDIDDTDDNGDNGDIGDSEDTDDEQPSRDDGDIFSLNMRAVNTSSSSISESELGGFDTGGTGNLPAARKLCSSSSSWPMKFKFGDIIGLASLTNLYASISDSDL